MATRNTSQRRVEVRRDDPKCEDEKGFKITIAKFAIQDLTDDDAKAKAIEHIDKQIEADLNNKGVTCNKQCAEPGCECYVDIDPPIDAQISTKPILKYNAQTKRFERAYVARMKKDTIFTISCQCAFLA